MKECSYARAIGNSGEIFFEAPKIWTSKPATSLVEKQGIDMIIKTMKVERGLICLTPHMGAFELAPRVLAEL